MSPVKQQTTTKDGHFQRVQSTFRNAIDASDANAVFPVETDRYHLYVSYACPWAHRTLITRALLGLESHISVNVVDPMLPPEGWYFSEYPGSTLDQNHNATYLRELYTRAGADDSVRVTVPVLWDKKQATICNNESREIIRMLSTQFATLSNGVELAPKKHRETIDAMIDANYETINNGVYRCGFATTQQAYETAFDELFNRLDEVEQHLSSRTYLVGEQLTEADICLYTTLIRFDSVYVGHFKCNQQRIVDYPAISRYLKQLYEQAAFRETTNMRHIKEHYYKSHTGINPTGIVPKGPTDLFPA